MSGGPTIIDIGSTPAERPSDSPRRGERRIVKLLPTPWNTHAPCLWRSPLSDIQDGVRGRWCVGLIDRTTLGVHKPQTAAMFVPDALWDHLPEDVVEW